MAKVQLTNIVARYGSLTALRDVTFHVEDGSFCVVVGPAGAGKTTLLNVIAGIKRPDAGSVHFNQQEVTEVPTWLRNVAMVFENYALYPHMSVFENMASPLRRLRYPRDRVEKIVRETAEMLGIGGLLHQLPANLSNGQRQRVAIGRAIVRPSHVLLMDEPLAHLDAKIASAMRLELKRLQATLNQTVIYVTHEYREALSLADWLVVLHDGKVLQEGTPQEVFYRPSSLEVARMFGDPPRNLIPGELDQEGGRLSLRIDGTDLRVDLSDQWSHITGERARRVVLGVLPGDIIADASLDLATSFDVRDTGLPVQIAYVEPQGRRNLVAAKLGSHVIHFYTDAETRCRSGETIRVHLKLNRSVLFEMHQGTRIGEIRQVVGQ